MEWYATKDQRHHDGPTQPGRRTEYHTRTDVKFSFEFISFYSLFIVISSIIILFAIVPYGRMSVGLYTLAGNNILQSHSFSIIAS